jgi:CspA family cold shock protein
MATGIVRFYNSAKGFGMITPDLGGPAIFARSNEIVGGKVLRVSQRVDFNVCEAPDGAFAAKIRNLP